MKFRKIHLWAAAGLLPALCGCVSIDYTGREDLAPLAENAKIAVFYDKSKLPLPETGMEKVGEIVARASTASRTVNDMRVKIVAAAREHGANLVLVTAVDYKPNGEARADQIQNIPSPGWTTVDNTQSNIEQERNTLLYASGGDPDITTYLVTMKATLFKVDPSVIEKKKDLPAPKPAAVPLEQQRKAIKIRVI